MILRLAEKKSRSLLARKKAANKKKGEEMRKAAMEGMSSMLIVSDAEILGDIYFGFARKENIHIWAPAHPYLHQVLM